MNHYNVCTRNNNLTTTVSACGETTTPTRLALHKFMQRMKSPLSRNRDSTTPKSSFMKMIDNLITLQGHSNKLCNTTYKSRPTKFQVASYGCAVLNAVQNDTQALQQLLENGISPNPYNAMTQEFLVHTVCQSRNVDVLKLLIQYGGSNVVQCVDAFGCTPLHIVCRDYQKTASADQLEMAKILLTCDPQMFYKKDCRNAEAFSYIPESQYNQWVSFLTMNRNDIWTSRNVENKKQKSYKDQLTIEIALMLASGRMDPSEVELFQYDDTLLLSQKNGGNDSSYFTIEKDNDTVLNLSFFMLNENSFDSIDKNDDDNSVSTYGETNELANILDGISVGK